MSQANTSNTPPLHSYLSFSNISPNQPVESEQVEDFKELLSSAAEVIVSEESSTEASYQAFDESVTNNTDWFALARKLRQQNRDLIKTVVQLEQALAESQEKLQAHKLQSRNSQTLLTQQAEELNITKEQATRLRQELDTSAQTIQQQQHLIDNLRQQLESAQEQVAQRERECGFLQENAQQQSQKLLATEQQVRELRARLQRQQRYTLQYKAALDQYLELPAADAHPQPDNLSSFASVSPKIPSIQPWSSQSENLMVIPQTNEVVDEPNSTEQLQSSQLQSSFDQAVEASIIESEQGELSPEPILAQALSGEVNPEQPTLTQKANWPSPSICLTEDSSQKRQSKPMIDLPTFLRSRFSQTGEQG